VFCLLVVLVKLSLLAKWLARKTPLRKPNCGEGIMYIKPRPKRAYDCVGLLYSFVVSLHAICVLLQPYVIHFLLVWHDIAYFCWKCLKTPTNLLTGLCCSIPYPNLTFLICHDKWLWWWVRCSMTMLPHPPVMAPCRLRGCKNWPAPFPGRMSYKATKPDLSVVYLSMFYCIVVY